jgi:O-antigen/teichoic acid export membrane protein
MHKLLSNKFFKNPVVIYLITRYLTYAIQFVLSIFIALKLSPYTFGIWSFLLLLLSYFQIFNFGISNSINVLTIQNKNKHIKTNRIVSNAFFLTSIMGVLILIICVLTLLFGENFFLKYNVSSEFYVICIIAILLHFNNLFMTIFRVKNELKEISIYQSFIPFFSLLSVLIFKDEVLLYTLLVVYVVGHIFSLILFIKKKIVTVKFKNSISLDYCIKILKKGFYLFIFNLSFQLLIVSLRTIVSVFFTVEEFGLFNFSYTISNSIILLLEAIAFIIFPKIIDKFHSSNNEEIEKIINLVKINYVTASNLLVYVAILFFPALIHFTPNYGNAYLGLNLVALSIIVQSQTFGYNAFLIAKNKEKQIALFSTLSLIICIALSLILTNIYELSFNYIFISLFFAYYFLSICYTYLSNKIIGNNINFLKLIDMSLSTKNLIPLIVALLIVILDYRKLTVLPLLVFIFLNIKSLLVVKKTVYGLINNPEILKIKK